MRFLKIILAFLVVALIAGVWYFFAPKTPADLGNLKKFGIAGESMAPTIKNGDEVFVDIEYYKTNPIEHGDIVAIKFSLSQNKVKRVIAIGGDKVEFRDGGVFVNDISSPTNYLMDARKQFDPARLRILKIQLGEKGIVPTGTLLVLGDNRTVSEDSQQFGLVSTEQVMGKAMYRTNGNSIKQLQ